MNEDITPKSQPQPASAAPAPATQEERDEQLIQQAFQHLLDTYLASNHRRKTEIITKAFNFAKQAHKGVRRLSGEPYILHPIAVAQIACEEIGLGSTSICAALLHDVEEDTDYTNEDLSNLFGPKVANIVEGLTKISGGIFGDRASLQAETFKKLLLTMSDDIRVILIKIADRLHNMRTLESMLPMKQYKIAGETLYIFAPIADRLGLGKIKTELEDLSFRYEHPEEYANITRLLSASKLERDVMTEGFIPPIRQALEQAGFDFTIKARVKSPYSIWMKMQNKKIPFEEVFDILAIRIVFHPHNRQAEVADCFRIYSLLTGIYKPHPTRFRDWLSNPKANGYQALHNTFMPESGPCQGKWIEVQIRSDRMDDIAEGGIAAHWKYKGTGAEYDENELDKWIGSIKEILDDPQPDTLDLLDTIKLNLFASEILVFTPKGEIRTMPQGATVLDFAFSIHSFLGSHCFGAKVNHKLVPLSHRLRSGDQVEILTSRSSHVTADWLPFATTAKARGKIQAQLRRERREQGAKGEELLRQQLQAAGLEATTALADRLAAHLGLPGHEELYTSLAEGKLQLLPEHIDHLRGKKPATRRAGGWRRYIPFVGKSSAEAPAAPDALATPPAAAPEAGTVRFVSSLNRKQVLTLGEQNLCHATMATCCHPIPGDDVLGYITPRNTLDIHLRSCPEATKLKTRYGNNIIACAWDTHKQLYFDTRIFLRGVDSHGVLHSIADVFERLNHYLVREITLSTRDGIFEGSMLVSVFDTEDVDCICQQLAEIENVTKAVRM